MTNPRHGDCAIDGIGVGEPCVHCGMSFGSCWELDGGWCCGTCRNSWSRAHVVEHEVSS
jgi:hypothetical protein